MQTRSPLASIASSCCRATRYRHCEANLLRMPRVRQRWQLRALSCLYQRSIALGIASSATNHTPAKKRDISVAARCNSIFACGQARLQRSWTAHLT